MATKKTEKAPAKKTATKKAAAPKAPKAAKTAKAPAGPRHPKGRVAAAHGSKADLAKALVQRSAQNGLVLLSCGVYSNVIRFLMPLTASDAIIDEGLDILERSLREIVG